MSRASGLALCAAALLGLIATPASAKTAPPGTGAYKGTTSQGSTIRFAVANKTCAPNMRGGNQHKRRGYCLVPSRTPPAITERCPSGFVFRDVYNGIFEVLLSAKGKLTLPEEGGNGNEISIRGVFSVAVTSGGRASGYLDQRRAHALDTQGKLEWCPSGRVSFTARRV
jgi:hypothetical protein